MYQNFSVTSVVEFEEAMYSYIVGDILYIVTVMLCGDSILLISHGLNFRV